LKFVCLLRGINVGGNNKVDMKTLKRKMEQAGLINVLTYINSGNIIFESEIKDVKKHQVLIHDLILNVFNVDSRTLVIGEHEFIDIANHIPENYQNNDESKADVLFYYPEITQDLIDSIPVKKEIEDTVYHDKALIVCVSRNNQPKSGLIKIVGTKVYELLTIRNVNTVRKLKELLAN